MAKASATTARRGRVTVGTALLPARPAEEARLRRLAKRAGLVFFKERGKGATYGVQSPGSIYFNVSLNAIEKKIRELEAGQNAKPRHKKK